MAIPRKKLLLDVDLNAMIEAKVNSMLQTASITGYPNYAAAQSVGTHGTYSYYDEYASGNQGVGNKSGPGVKWVVTQDGWCAVSCRGGIARILVNGKVIHVSVQGDNYSDQSSMFPVKKNDVVLVRKLYDRTNDAYIIFMPNR